MGGRQQLHKPTTESGPPAADNGPRTAADGRPPAARPAPSADALVRMTDAEGARRAGWRWRLRRFWWQRVRPAWRRFEWPVVWGLALGALLLGYLGFDEYHAGKTPPKTWYDNLYYAVQLYILQSGAVDGPPPLLEAARWLAPAVTAYTATKALLVLFHDQFNALRLRRYRGHLVICGLGRKGSLIARSMREAGRRVVVVDANEQNPRIERCREVGAVVVVGNAADRAVLRKAGAERARWLVSVLPDDGENAEVAGQARALAAGRRGEGLTCLAHIAEPQLCDLLVERELATAEAGAFRQEFFNVFQLGARELLRQHDPFAAQPEPHLLVVGLGRMGMSLIAQAAGEWHARRPDPQTPLHVTVVDLRAEEKYHSLLFSHPQVAAVCRVRRRQLEVYSTEFQSGVFLRRRDDEGPAPPVTTAYVCLDQDAAGLYAALTLVRLVAGRSVSVVVRMTHDAGMAKLFGEGGRAAGPYAGLHAFKLLDRVCHRGLLSAGKFEAIARAIHAAYVRERERAGQTPQANPSLVPWDQLPEVLRASNYEQAQHIGVKLRALGYDIERATGDGRAVTEFSEDEIELMAEMEHDRWMRAMVRNGFSYESEAGGKTHKALLPWQKLSPEERARRYTPEEDRAIGQEALPEEQKRKDREAVVKIPSLLAAVNYQACKRRDRRRPRDDEG